jgi:glycosyltransferase involved in cell wall biosynthesis
MPDVSVVVPTYNQSALLAECLRSLANQTLAGDRYEIVVVDDGSTDATPDVIRQAGARVRGVRLATNRGRSAARNAGVEQARADLIVFTDSDVVVRPDFLAWHVQTHQRHRTEIVSRGPVILVPDVTSASRARIPRVAASPAYLDTANAGLKRATLRKAGMFDEHFPGYGWEDFELGMRLKRLGIQRVFSARAAAFHIQPPLNGNALGELLRKEEARARSAVYFYRKVPGLETRLLIQATPLHRGLYWLLSAGGLLTPANVPRLSNRLRKSGLASLAFLALRGVLNRHYIQSLRGEFRRNAALVA